MNYLPLIFYVVTFVAYTLFFWLYLVPNKNVDDLIVCTGEGEFNYESVLYIPWVFPLIGTVLCLIFFCQQETYFVYVFPFLLVNFVYAKVSYHELRLDANGVWLSVATNMIVVYPLVDLHGDILFLWKMAAWLVITISTSLAMMFTTGTTHTIVTCVIYSVLLTAYGISLFLKVARSKELILFFTVVVAMVFGGTAYNFLLRDSDVCKDTGLLFAEMIIFTGVMSIYLLHYMYDQSEGITVDEDLATTNIGPYRKDSLDEMTETRSQGSVEVEDNT